MRVAIVAGEMSGDYLGAGLMRALRERCPDVHFEGVGGQRMAAEGLETLYPLESLSVMGLVEVCRHLPRLLGIRRDLARRFLANPPDVFIGIDAPDFNLGLEKRLRRYGVPTVHYVSPTVWAWRRGRIRGIRRAVDRMLCIFPFEPPFYHEHGVPATFVGHPLADEIPMEPDAAAAREALGLPQDGEVVALLPGSRVSEVERLGPVFLETAAWLHRHRPDLRFIVPCASPRIREVLTAIRAARNEGMAVQLVDERSRDCLSAAHVALLASGTASLEAMLHKRPMVVAYRVAPVTAWVARRLVDVAHIAMPNLIAGQRLVAEFTQGAAVSGNLGPAILDLLENDERRAELNEAFCAIHGQLRCGASAQAADAVLTLVRGEQKPSATRAEPARQQ